MKKLYSLVAALMAVSSVWATAPMSTKADIAPISFNSNLNGISKNAVIEPKNLKPLTDMSTYGFVKKTDAEIAQAKANKAPAKAVSLSNYTSMGTEARLYSTEFAVIGLTPETIKAELYAHNTESGKYVVSNAFANTNFSEYVTPLKATIAIDATNPDKVYVDGYNVCSFTNTAGTTTTMQMITQVDFYITYYTNTDGSAITFEQLYNDDNYSSMFGTYNNGIITFPPMVACINGSPYSYTPDDNIVAFPGKKFYHTYLNASKTFLTNDDTASIVFYFGGDIASVKIDLDTTYLEPDEDIFKSLAASTSEDIVSATWPSYYNLSTANFSNSHFPFTYVMVGLDEDGNYVQGDVMQFYYQPDESDNWKSIGNGYIIDGIYSDVFEGATSLWMPLTAEFEEHKDYPGYLRIKNPYAGSTDLSSVIDTDNDFYLYVLAFDGYPVCIEPSSLGVVSYDYGYSMVRSISYDDYLSYLNDKTYQPNATYAATFDKEENTISFPKNSMLLAFPYFYQGEFMQVNSTGSFLISLPEDYKVGAAGVNDIYVDSNNGEAEYYNLQGARIANPTPGQLVIRRQGGTSTKVLVK